jgi:hypothetical protein
MQPYQAKIERVNVPGGSDPTMRETIRRMGRAIRNASTYPPIRNHAAAVATTAAPKDFIGQLNAIYDDFTDRWRYVKDPASRELLTASPEAIWRLTMAGDGVGVGKGKGAGDCDCAAVALGAQLEAIGFPVRLGTTIKDRRPGKLFGHVFIQAHVPGRGWVTVDPVLYPGKSFGAVARHTRIGWWDLDGNFIGAAGNYSGGNSLSGTEEAYRMIGPNICRWRDYGIRGPVSINLGWIPTHAGQQSAIGRYGYLDGEELGGLTAEVDDSDDIGGGFVRTPVLELAIDDYDYVRRIGRPYAGMMALGDAGDVYYYDGLGGFKKFIKKVGKGIGKIMTPGLPQAIDKAKSKKKKKKAKKPSAAPKKPTVTRKRPTVTRKRPATKSPIRTAADKDRDDKVMVKIGGELADLAMKIIRPLVIQATPIQQALRLAPIAALIPGAGPAIAKALKAGAAAVGAAAKTPAVKKARKSKSSTKRAVRKGKLKIGKTRASRKDKATAKRHILRTSKQMSPTRINAGSEAEARLHKLFGKVMQAKKAAALSVRTIQN